MVHTPDVAVSGSQIFGKAKKTESEKRVVAWVVNLFSQAARSFFRFPDYLGASVEKSGDL